MEMTKKGKHLENKERKERVSSGNSND